MIASALARPPAVSRHSLTLGALVMLLLCCALLSLTSGAVHLNTRELFDALRGESAQRAAIILWEIRLPRLLLGALIGAGLAVCGAVMQGLFRNPLADPGLIGVSSGSALGASLAIVLAGNLAPAWLQPWIVSLMAFAGGLVVTVLVYRLASRGGQASIAILLLAGVAMTAIAEAGVGVMNYLADDTQLRDITYWRMGSLGAASWQSLTVCAVLGLPALAFLLRLGRPLNALLLGEAEARHLGIRIEHIKRHAVIASALLIGACVAAAGSIGFVGLVVPHLLRLINGANHRLLLPACALAGAGLLVLADLASRTLVAPAELPIGILTALLGGPFFLWLLLQQRGKEHL